MSKPADSFLYKYLERVSGPQAVSGDDKDMNTDSALTPSVFEYEVVNTHVDVSRFNINVMDASESPEEFAGLNVVLANGCLLQVIDVDGSTVLLDFTNGAPIKKNADFNLLAGVDVTHEVDAGDDLLSIRFTVARAGSPMRLKKGQRVRWTNQDDLGAVTEMRVVMQGVVAMQ